MALIDAGYISEAMETINDLRNSGQKDFRIDFLQLICEKRNEEIPKLEAEICDHSTEWCLDLNLSKELLEFAQYYSLRKLFLKAYVAISLIDKQYDLSSYDRFIKDNYVIQQKYNVFQGPINIANQMGTMTKALREKGIQVRSFSLYPQNYLNYDIDEYVTFAVYEDQSVRTAQIISWLGEIIFTYDLFHFHFGTSLLNSFEDLKLIKKFGKKIIMTHWGSEVRKIELAAEITPYAVAKQDSKWIHENMLKLVPYIDLCTVCDMELYYYVKSYYKNIKIIPIAYDLTNHYNVKKSFSAQNQRDSFRIVHAPTAREFKGTDYVEKAIQSLIDKGYNIDYVLVEGVSNEEALKIYETADLVIDQLRAGQYGFLAVECMARNIPVIAYISDYMKQYLDIDLPVINANIDNIETVLEKCILNSENLVRAFENGYDYVDKQHNIENIVQQMIKQYDELMRVKV